MLLRKNSHLLMYLNPEDVKYIDDASGKIFSKFFLEVDELNLDFIIKRCLQEKGYMDSNGNRIGENCSCADFAFFKNKIIEWIGILLSYTILFVEEPL